MEWSREAWTIHVNVFERAESMQLLSRRVDTLTTVDAEAVAEGSATCRLPWSRQQPGSPRPRDGETLARLANTAATIRTRWWSAAASPVTCAGWVDTARPTSSLGVQRDGQRFDHGGGFEGEVTGDVNERPAGRRYALSKAARAMDPDDRLSEHSWSCPPAHIQKRPAAQHRVHGHPVLLSNASDLVIRAPPLDTAATRMRNRP